MIRSDYWLDKNLYFLIMSSVKIYIIYKVYKTFHLNTKNEIILFIRKQIYLDQNI